MEPAHEVAVPLSQFVEKFLKNLATDMRVLISSDVVPAVRRTTLLKNAGDIVPIFDEQWALAFIREDGTGAGDLHFLFSIDSAIAFSGLMMMMGESSLKEMILQRDYSEDLREAFGEIANVATGVMNTLVEQRVKEGHLHLENTAHLGEGKVPETLNGELYVDVAIDVTVGELCTAPLHILLSKDFAEALTGAKVEYTGAAQDAPAASGANAGGAAASSIGAADGRVSLAALMTDPPSTAGEDEPVSNAIAVMENQGIRQIGVVRDGTLVRVISWGNLRQLMGPFYGTNAMSARDKAVLGIRLGNVCKTQKLISITMTGSVSEALELMITHQLKALPVVDENGALRGFIPARELLKLLRTLLH